MSVWSVGEVCTLMRMRSRGKTGHSGQGVARVTPYLSSRGTVAAEHTPAPTSAVWKQVSDCFRNWRF